MGIKINPNLFFFVQENRRLSNLFFIHHYEGWKVGLYEEEEQWNNIKHETVNKTELQIFVPTIHVKKKMLNRYHRAPGFLHTSQDVFWSAFSSACYYLLRLLRQSERPYTLCSATDQDSYIVSKCHFTSISPDTFMEEVFHVVTCARGCCWSCGS